MFRTIICTLAAIFLISTTSALAEDNYTKAENFIKVGRLDDAIQALEAQIALRSDDARAYFMLGDIYLRQNSFVAADREFQAAITFRSAYRSEVAKKYHVLALASLQSREMETAKRLFDGAIKWDGNLKSQIAKRLFDNGQYELAILYNPGFRESLADKFYAKGEAANSEASLPYYRQAKKFSAKYNEAVKAKLLAIAKTKFEEKDITFWREAAAEFGKIPPDYKIYEPGTYIFSLKAGEKTDHWITFPARGVVINYSISSSDYQYKLLYDDGEIVKDGKDVVYPHKTTHKLKIIAITDQPKITMTVVQGQLSAIADK